MVTVDALLVGFGVVVVAADALFLGFWWLKAIKILIN